MLGGEAPPLPSKQPQQPKGEAQPEDELLDPLAHKFSITRQGTAWVGPGVLHRQVAVLVSRPLPRATPFPTLELCYFLIQLCWSKKAFVQPQQLCVVMEPHGSGPLSPLCYLKPRLSPSAPWMPDELKPRNPGPPAVAITHHPSSCTTLSTFGAPPGLSRVHLNGLVPKNTALSPAVHRTHSGFTNLSNLHSSDLFPAPCGHGCEPASVPESCVLQQPGCARWELGSDVICHDFRQT